MTSLVRARGGHLLHEFVDLVADGDVAIVTLSVTERGYGPDSTVPPLLLGALDARRRAGLGGLAIVPCDNLRSNGTRLRSVLLGLVGEHNRDLGRWLTEHVSFVDTVSDRITPATTARDVALAADMTGFPDRAPVTTEPFAEWVLAGRFPAGRPAWESAGACFVEDIRPFERRKLRLLNGGHLLLALAGQQRGHRTVADAMADPELRVLVEQYWSAASHGIPGADEYLHHVRARFSNPRLWHLLEQIAVDAEEKLRERIVPVVSDLLARCADPTPALRVVAAWLTHIGAASNASLREAALDRLVPDRADDRQLRGCLSAATTTPKD